MLGPVDEALRDAERAAGSGDVDDVARLLVLRVRTGRLARDCLRRAAWLGDEPARRACEALGERVAPLPDDPAGWLLGLGRVDHVVPWVRAAADALADRVAAGRLVAESADDHDAHLAAIRSWTDDPGPARFEAATEATRAALFRSRVWCANPAGLGLTSALRMVVAAAASPFQERFFTQLERFSRSADAPLDELRDRARARLVALALATPAARS